MMAKPTLAVAVAARCAAAASAQMATEQEQNEENHQPPTGRLLAVMSTHRPFRQPHLVLDHLAELGPRHGLHDQFSPTGCKRSDRRGRHILIE